MIYWLYSAMVCVLINILHLRAVPFANGVKLNKDYFSLLLGSVDLCGLAE